MRFTTVVDPRPAALCADNQRTGRPSDGAWSHGLILNCQVRSLTREESRRSWSVWQDRRVTGLFPYDPSVRTKILGISGVTVGLIIWAWALMYTAQIVWYGFWLIFNTLTGAD